MDSTNEEKKTMEERLKILGLMRLDSDTHRLYDFEKLHAFVKSELQSLVSDMLGKQTIGYLKILDKNYKVVSVEDIEIISKERGINLW